MIFLSCGGFKERKMRTLSSVILRPPRETSTPKNCMDGKANEHLLGWQD